MTADLYQKNERYHVMLSWYQDGKRKQKSVATGIPVKGDNKRKAKERKYEILNEYEAKIVKNDRNTLFADYLKRWVYASQARVSPTTYDVYEHMLDKHLYPYFHELGVEVSKVTPAIVEKYYNAKEGEGLSTNTVIKHHSILRSALQKAHKKDKIIKENPCDLIDAEEKPKRTKYRGEFYNVEEIKALLEAANGTPIETAIYFAAYFGLRRSEVIGLKWDAIDFTNNVIKIKHKVVRMKKDGKMTTYATNDLKTESSYRELPLDDFFVAYLKDLKKRQEEDRIRNGNSHIGEYKDYICINELGDRVKPDYVTNFFGRIISRNGLKKIRYHDLRHSCASLLLALGYSMKEIQEWLGHSNYLTTANLYSHVDPRNKKNMIASLSNALSV